MDQASLLSVPEDHHDHHDCSEEEEQEASKICGKHMAESCTARLQGVFLGCLSCFCDTLCWFWISLWTKESSEVFADCVFDVCHGGGEEAAEDAAEFIESEGAEY